MTQSHDPQTNVVGRIASPSCTQAEARRAVYALLITLAAGLTLGRIASVERLHEPSVHRTDSQNVPRPAWPKARPEPSTTFGSNDRSRWALIRALVDHGTFVIGERDRGVVLASAPAGLAAADPLQAAVLQSAGYQARVGSDRGVVFEEGYQSVDKVLHPGEMKYYSTKPPLLTLLAAGEYWVLKKAFGWSLDRDAGLVVRAVLVTFNLVPLVVYLAVLGGLADRFAKTDWARFYVVAAGGFATMVTPFLITFNNHTVATAAAAVLLYAVVRIREGGGPGWFALAGLMAGLTASFELPAAALAAAAAVYLLWRAPGRALLVFVPLAVVPVAAALAANYAELGQLTPAYAEVKGPWYQYEGSHWRVPPDQVKRGIDFARRNGETHLAYLAHLLVGHHGWFSLMPIMFLGLAGMGMAVREAGPDDPPTPEAFRGLFALFALLISGVVLAFYLYISDNYGGWTNGPRWLMWLTPLWLVGMLPALDALAGRKAGRGLALALLGLSILSMSYQLWNPWRHPWIFNWMESRGWIAY